MELRQLKHFDEIVRASSFGRAADKLNITQPALSKSIRNLERSLGCILLERHPAGVTATDYGRVFLDHATLVTSELDRAVEELNELKGRGKGVVRVGAGATMSKYLLPQAVKRYIQGDGQGRVTFRDGLKDELLALLRCGEIDVMVGSIGRGPVDEDLRQESVLEDRITVVADAVHPLGGREPLSIADLAAHKWVLPDGSESEGEALQRAFRAANQGTIDCAVRTDSSLFMASLLKGSQFLSYLPAAPIALDAAYAHLVPIPTEPAIWAPVPVGVTYRRRGVMLQSTRRFINRLKDVGAELSRG